LLTRRELAAAMAAVSMAGNATTAHSAATPPTVDEILKDPELTDVALSPEGGRLAVLRQKTTGGKTHAWIQFYDLLDDKTPDKPPTPLGEATVSAIEWANEERLLVWVVVDKLPNGDPTGLQHDWGFYKIPIQRILAINTDGASPVILFGGHKSITRRLFNLARVVDMMRDDPRHILMQLWDVSREAEAIYRVDVYSGEAVRFEVGAATTYAWLTQNGAPVVRYDSNPRGTMVTINVRAPGETGWKVYRKVRRNELEKLSELEFVAPTPETGVLLMLAQETDSDMPVLRRFDTRDMQAGEVVAREAEHPIDTVFVDEAFNPVSIGITDDLTRHKFLDRTLAAHAKGIGAYLGGEVSVRPYDISRDHKRLIFFTSGPRQPGAFWLYDIGNAKLAMLGEQRPWLTKDRLAPMKILSVKTRDGATITAYLSTPIGPATGALPMVVLPHGGPETRDQLDFDSFVQTFAARGWLVLQPNFRGSGGYGRSFADQGRRHWGDRMQEDVEDCVAQVVAAGLADPKRIAICGASYGGYAALMGAVRNPALYKTVVSIAGVSDLPEMLTYTQNEDGADSSAYAYWRKTIGDPKTDRVMLETASPARRAREIRAPVLLIHGTEDGIVPVKQSRIMDKAMKAAGKPCDLVEIKGAGHRGWTNEQFRTVLTHSADHIAKALS
jgi:dipeptidyl aminopeptidase/acylaminoacyl peptidase